MLSKPHLFALVCTILVTWSTNDVVLAEDVSSEVNNGDKNEEGGAPFKFVVQPRKLGTSGEFKYATPTINGGSLEEQLVDFDEDEEIDDEDLEDEIGDIQKRELQERMLSPKSTKAPSLKSTKAPSLKSTKAPSLKSTKAPSLKSTKAPSLKSSKSRRTLEEQDDTAETVEDRELQERMLSPKSTKAPSLKSTKAPSLKSTKAPSLKSTKAPSLKSSKSRRKLEEEQQ